MAICGIVSSSKPARCAHCSAVCSILLTLSRVESSVKLTRLVVESAKAVLEILMCQSSSADNSDDGSVLVDARKVKDAWSLFSPIGLPLYGTSCSSCTSHDKYRHSSGLRCGHEEKRMRTSVTQVAAALFFTATTVLAQQQ